MKPTYEQYQKSCATWKRSHKQVSYTLSHHGISDYSPEGTWCFYIHLLENMFVNPADFALFDREPEIRDMGSGSYWETYPYSDVPDYGFHGGITFYERDTYVAKDGQRYKTIKMGCDYAHLWDRDRGYPDDLDDVDLKAKRFIDELVERHPMKVRCVYSGIIDMPDKFYEAINGATVHESHKEKLKADGWDGWLPKSQEAA